MKINLSNPNDYLASIFGMLLAVANAWGTIDWEHFEFNQGTIFHLGVSGLIAIGGWKTSIITKKTS